MRATDADHGWPNGPCADGPIRGIRVLDFTRILAGPYATMHLADLGADVIKVELPGRGDETRHWGPPFDERGAATYFTAVNHNKRSIALDLADPRDREVALRLAAHADVVVDNFLPGKMESFGLDAATLRRANPAVITASVSGFGAGNAYSGRPGFDFLAQAMGGLMSITGYAGNGPLRVGVAVADLMSGVFLCAGVLAALAGVRGGEPGRHIDVSLLDTQISMLANVASGWLAGGTEPMRFGNQHPSIAPYETLRTGDGVLAVAVGTDRQFRGLCSTLGLQELTVDPRFASNAARIGHRAELVALLEHRLSTDTSGNWLAALVVAGVPASPVNTVGEALSDPVVRDRMIATLDDEHFVRSPIAIDGRLPEVFAPPPRLGEHTAEVLAHLREGIPLATSRPLT